jgi:hypothetical protein
MELSESPPSPPTTKQDGEVERRAEEEEESSGGREKEDGGSEEGSPRVEEKGETSVSGFHRGGRREHAGHERACATGGRRVGR